MTSGDSHVLHLALRTEWEAARSVGQYRRSTRGRSLDEVGFIHGSLTHQLADVAQMIFADCDEDLVVLVMDLEDLRAAGIPVRFEDGGNGELYPHIYAGVPCDLVADVRSAGFDVRGAFHVE